MKMFLSLLMVMGILLLKSQNITGTWEGVMSDEYFKLSVTQKGNELCGQTYDVVIDNKNNYCKTYFKGQYDPTLEIWYMKGFQFIERSGDHLLMTIKFWKVDQSDSKIMMANVTSSDSPMDFFGMESGVNFWVRKISNTPQTIAEGMSICCQNNINQPEIAKNKEPKINNKKKKIQKTTQDIETPDKEINENITIKDTLKQSIIEDEMNQVLYKEMNERQTKTVTKLIVNEPKIELYIFDNAIVDNDTVSIFFDGKLIVSHQKLSTEPIKIELDVSDYNKIYHLVMFAENLGSIPPNTALIVVKAGKKRHELHSSANLNENAELLFKYQP